MKAYRFSECGVKHRLHGLENQDACFVEAHGGHAFAFMADGMSSARYGDEAANIAVEAGRDIMGRLFMPLDAVETLSGLMVVRAAFPAAYNAIQRAAQNQDDLNELLTTFMAVYFNEGMHRLHVGYCGDGGVIARKLDGSIDMVTKPQKGASRSQTTQVLDVRAWDFVSAENVDAFMVLTDGLFDALCPGGALPRGDAARMEAIERLLEAPLGLDDPRMKPYLDCAFSSKCRNDDLGSLFECVGDDRSVIIVCADPKHAERYHALHAGRVEQPAAVHAAAQATQAVPQAAQQPMAPDANKEGEAERVAPAANPAAPTATARLAMPAMPALQVAAAPPFPGVAPATATATGCGLPAVSSLPLTPQECQQVRLLMAAYADTRRTARFRKKMEGSHANAR